MEIATCAIQECVCRNKQTNRLQELAFPHILACGYWIGRGEKIHHKQSARVASLFYQTGANYCRYNKTVSLISPSFLSTSSISSRESKLWMFLMESRLLIILPAVRRQLTYSSSCVASQLRVSISRSICRIMFAAAQAASTTESIKPKLRPEI